MMTQFNREAGRRLWFALRFLLMASVLGRTSLDAACEPAAASLVALYRLDGDGNEAIEGLPGQVMDGVTFGNPWIGSAAASFNQYGAVILVPPPVARVDPVHFTLEGWIRRNSVLNVKRDVVGILYTGFETGSIAFGLLDDGRLVLSSLGLTQVQSTQKILDDAWHHVAVVHDGAQVRFYIDGQVAGEGNDAGVYSPASRNAFGGFVAPTSTGLGTFIGSLDDWAIYSGALTGEAVARIHAAGQDGKCGAGINLRMGGVPPVILAGAPFEVTLALTNRNDPAPLQRPIEIIAPAGIRFDVVRSGPGSFVVTSNRVEWLPPVVVPGEAAEARVRANALQDSGRFGILARRLEAGTPVQRAGLQVVPDCLGGTNMTLGWTLDGVARDSVKGLEGTLQGAATYRTGRNGVGQALSINGADAGLTTSNPGLVEVADFTVEFWVRRSGLESAGSQGADGVCFGGGDRSFAVGMRAAGEIFLTHVGVIAVDSSVRIRDLEWHHVAVTRSGPAVRFIVDGQPAGNRFMSAAYLIPGSFGIGRLAVPLDAKTYSFLGALDDVRFHQEVVADQILRRRGLGAADCAADLAIFSEPFAPGVRPGETNVTEAWVTNLSLDTVSDVRIDLHSNAAIQILAVTGEGVEAHPAADGQEIRLGSMLAGETRRVRLGYAGAAEGLGKVDLEVRAPGRLLPWVIDDGISLGIGVGQWCEELPPGSKAWINADQGFGDIIGTVPVAVEGTVESVPGKVGAGFRTSSGSLVIQDSARFNIPAFTIQAWIRPDKLDGGIDTILAQEINPSQISNLHLGLGIRGPLFPGQGSTPGRLLFTCRGGAGLPNSFAGWTDTGVTLPLAAWTHVAMGCAPGLARVWVNGKMVGEYDGLPSGFVYVDAPLRMSGRTPSAGLVSEMFDGAIDEVIFTEGLLDRDAFAGIPATGRAGYCNPDLVLSGDPVPARVALGENFRIGWSVTNVSRNPSRFLVLEQELPPGWLAEALTADVGTIGIRDGKIVAGVDELAAGKGVRFSAVLKPSAPFNGTLVTTVTGQDGDITPGNNSTSASVEVAPSSVSVDSVSMIEGDMGIQSILAVPVRLFAPVSHTVTVDYQTGPARPGSGLRAATPGEDYLSTSGSLLFQPGEVEKLVPVPIRGDAELEQDEAFGLVLQNVSGAVIVAPLPVLRLVNDDTVQIRIGDARREEGDSTPLDMVFPVTISGISAVPIELDWETTNDTARLGFDFSIGAGTVVVPAGARSAEIRVPLIPDTVEEANEVFRIGIALSPASAGLASLTDASAVGIVLNDDGRDGLVQRFEWVLPPGRQRPGVPVPVELRAVDGLGQLVKDYAGVVAFGAVPMAAPSESGTPSSLVIGEVHVDPTDRVKCWNVTSEPLDISNWRAVFYDAQRWPLPMATNTIPPGTILPAGGSLIFSSGSDPNPGAIRITDLRWDSRSTPGGHSQRRIAVLLQNPVGEVVDFFAAGGASPSEIHIPTSLDPSSWSGFPVPAIGSAHPVEVSLVHQRSGNSNPRSASAWSRGVPELLNRNLQLPFVDAEVRVVQPSQTGTFIQGIWRGSLTVDDPSEWMSLYADDGDGHSGANALLEFDVANDLRIHSCTLQESIIAGVRPFSQRVVVTNAGPADSSGVVLRVVLPQKLNATADGTSRLLVTQGTARLDPASGQLPPAVVATFGRLRAGESATLDFTLTAVIAAGSSPFEGRFIAEVTRAEPELSRANNRVERQIEINDEPSPPPAGRIAWIRGEGSVADTLGHLGATNAGAAFIGRHDRQAMQFDGNARIELAATPGLVLDAGSSEAAEISLWMRTRNLAASRMVLMEVEGNATTPGWMLSLEGGRPAVLIGSAIHVAPSTLADLRDGTWHHLTFQVSPGSATSVEFRVDAAGLAAVPLGPQHIPTRVGSGRARIGGATIGHGFVGDLDEITLVRAAKAELAGVQASGRTFRAGVRGTADAVLSVGLMRPGLSNSPAPGVGGRPYTVTIGITNSGPGASQPLDFLWARTGQTRPVTASFGGVPLPLDLGEVLSRASLPSIGSPASTDLVLNMAPATGTSLGGTLTLIGGLRDTLAQLTFSAAVRVDGDRDGIADDWESALGLDFLSSADALLDSDGDGYSNLAEFNSGTLPNDPSSYPQLAWRINAAGSLALGVSTLGDRDYVVEWRAELGEVGAGWNQLRVIRGTGAVVEVDDLPINPDGQGYFRVRAVPLW